MDPEDRITDMMQALTANDMNKVAAYLTDDFTCQTGHTKLNKRDFLGVMGGLMSALQPRAFNLYDAQTNGSQVQFTAKLDGTFVNALQVPIANNPSAKPNNQDLDVPESRWTYTLNGDKVSSILIADTPGGNLADIFKQLGVTVNL